LFGVASGMALSPHLGCSREGCVGVSGGAGVCVVPSPCTKLAFECPAGTSGALSAKVITSADELPGGIDALGAIGDLLLKNDRIVAVIDAIEHPHHVVPSGGAILDLATIGGDNDSINHIFQATGFLPGDAASYETLEILEGEGFRAIQVRGHLDGHPERRISTRYEVRPCEPGIRVRTELQNGEPDAAIWTVTDGWYWSGREALPFTPYPGAGFVHPSFDLTSVGDVYRRVPFMAAAGHADPAAAYSIVACNDEAIEGFHASTISATGTKRKVVAPRDYVVFERFIGVANGRAIGPAVDIALDVRRQLFGEAMIPLSGKVTVEDGTTLGSEARAAVLISEGTSAMPLEERTPWTEAIPAADGTFSVMVPANKTYVVEAQAFGRTVASKDVAASDSAIDAGEIALPSVGRVSLAVEIDGALSDALVFAYPADEELRAAVEGKLLGAFVKCAPLLGAPYGGSPACNRVLTGGGRVAFDAPAGRFDLFASAGPFTTIEKQTIEVKSAETSSITFHLARLPLLPRGALSADFHVHGGASFDSSIPDLPRVQAFLASQLDVIAATDHDVISNYDRAMSELGAGSRIILMPGIETTGHVLWKFVPDTNTPRVIGHWNFWPLSYLPDQPRNGAPPDDLVEPATLFDRMRASGFSETGVIQLNHPISDTDLGRDLGFARAIRMKLNERIRTEYDETGPSLFLRVPPGSDRSNASYDTQEVMNGSANDFYLAHRAFWFYLLNQGVVRAGTANSDSHGLTDNVLGSPRNIVWSRTTKEAFDPNTFNAAVKKGHILGTNGPIIEARVIFADGSSVAPSVDAIGFDSTRAAGARLAIKVSAAPWVYLDELRIVVNGKIVKTIDTGLVEPSDPYGRTGLVRHEDSFALSELLEAGTKDTWLVVEAGARLPLTGDLDCDGVPDTSDNDRNGSIDWRDVDRNDDDVVDASDLDANEDGKVDASDEPKACDDDQETGPLFEMERPQPGDRAYPFWSVSPPGYPASFTNPFLLDRDGGGFGGTGVDRGAQ
jgi:hypothetical protein